ncbi:hypothetical protein CROQUDRAFT_38137, partial [Cronartium quercuum f. sp. fusiforme G11]
QWATFEAILTVVFFECQHFTENWTSTPSYLTNQLSWNCQNSTRRPIELIDIQGRHSQYPITFCKCIPNPIGLLYVRYIASSPQEPHTAFSVGMIQLHHCLWQRTALPTNRFIKAMLDYINDQSHSLFFAHAHHGKQAECNLQKPLTYAFDLYQ